MTKKAGLQKNACVVTVVASEPRAPEPCFNLSGQAGRHEQIEEIPRANFVEFQFRSGRIPQFGLPPVGRHRPDGEGRQNKFNWPNCILRDQLCTPQTNLDSHKQGQTFLTYFRSLLSFW
jgi:hypothetical protein